MAPTHLTRTIDTTRAAQVVHWAPCPTCWGQRRIWTRSKAPNGEGAILVATTCEGCLGVGEVAR
jgi:hypothetical protein